MTLTYDKRELTKEEMAEFTPERCWADVERLSALLSEPGLLQEELKIHPKFGPEFEEASKELLHLLITEYDVGRSPSEQSVVDRIGDLFMKIERIQANHLLGEIAAGGVAMQMLPMDQMINSVSEEDISLITDKMSEADAAQIFAEREKAKESGVSMAAAKLDLRIVPIFSAGVQAAGGHAEFARLQMECAADLPEEYRLSGSLVFAQQMTGAVMKAVVRRAAHPDYVNMQARTLIESAIALKQALHMGTVPCWSATPTELLDVLQESMKGSVLRSIEACKPGFKEAAEEAVDSELVKPGSTVFSGNGTVN